ncbi:CheR family methyltransferase [Rhodopirellula sp. MGV]|uniref:CheR family methyltransferase n=1 Tax=Rhodopirellula sp. MGV TaxID=2023130 RepID=UPI000B95FF9B|nr:protein-glutamate O-methyltransferase CheR [Rhodopirellula sp. MGV]OYP36454.1 chemotaxis protein CheR [Rhodopirellula sp. MGV]PNY38872.1 protein-glutamate O-methyltransferase CheR [Rhodopirellula baltica]
MTLATSDIDFLRDLVAKHSGNVIAPRQVYMLEQRLAPLAGTIGLGDVPALVAKLRSTNDANLSNQVAEAVTVNETSFFRDMHVFEAMRKSVIPDLMKKNERSKEIRIWCAACSSGQEPYSLSMVIREHFPQLASWKVSIVATDLSEEMLSKSRSGAYSQLEVNRGLPAKSLVRYFERKGASWQAKRELSELIDFRRLNLTTPWPFLGQFDVIFIRNVLIYFDQRTKADILTRMRRALRPDGYLFIGAAETTIGLNVPFQRTEIDATVCYRPNSQ